MVTVNDGGTTTTRRASKRSSIAGEESAGVNRNNAASKNLFAALPWMQWHPGERVVVRYRASDGFLHDALGKLIEAAPDHVVVETRHGLMRVEATQMVTGKKVPPAPRR